MRLTVHAGFGGRLSGKGPNYRDLAGQPTLQTATRILSEDQLADYGPWFDSHRRLRELVTELEELSLAIVEADPRWNR